MAADEKTSRQRRARVARVAFGHVEPPGGFAGSPPLKAAQESFIPGTSVTRYNRTWYLGQVETGPVVTGRIGFDRLVGTSPLWDETRKDFSMSAVREGSTSPFAYHLRSRRVAFQLRSSTIKRQSFCGALQALLNEASPFKGWEVEPEAVATSFEDWRANFARRIVKVAAVVKVPNPHYEDEDVEELLDDAQAQAARLELTGDDLKLSDSQLLAQFFHHANRNPNYGHYKAQGVTSAGRRTEFDSRADESPLDASAPVDPETKEVPTSALAALVEPPPRKAALGKAAPEQVPGARKAGRRRRSLGEGPQALGPGPAGPTPNKG